MVSFLGSLPQEVLHSILCYCDPVSSAALGQTARRFKSASNESLLWRFYCLKYFQYWDHSHDLPGKLLRPAALVNWKALYVSRHHIDRATTRLLDSIISSQTGRLKKVRTIVQFGYDIKDTLLHHASVGPEVDDYLARRYYAQSIINNLHRSIAIEAWSKLWVNEATPLERALGAFDLFVSNGHRSLDGICMELDKIVTQLITGHPNTDQLTPRKKALAVASFLKANDLTGIELGREYHLLEHNFLGVSLDDPGHNSLPLVSAAIYCYVAQRIGLNAQLCGFPLHVHVIIIPSPGFDIDGNALSGTEQGDPMYMDPFRSEKETHVSTLQNQLIWLGASDAEQSTYLGESHISQIILRCGKNIMNSIQRIGQSPDIHPTLLDLESAKYAALWASVLATDPIRPADRRQYVPWLVELLAVEFSFDVYLAEQYLVPILMGLPEHERIMEGLHVMQAVDDEPKQIRCRSPENNNTRYRVGQVFRHRRYNYSAIITGWDTKCEADEHWARAMRIDTLPAGRHQSFYHVLYVPFEPITCLLTYTNNSRVEDKSVRYVAEENIELIAHPKQLPERLFAIAGKHFKRWDTQTRKFVSNIQDEYPDD